MESAKNNQENHVNKRDDVLLSAVGNPESVYRTKKKKKKRGFMQPRAVKKPFHKYEKTPLEMFVSYQIRPLKDDPGLLDEISVHMAMYLSSCIENEEDMKVVSDLLFEKVNI